MSSYMPVHCLLSTWYSFEGKTKKAILYTYFFFFFTLLYLFNFLSLLLCLPPTHIRHSDPFYPVVPYFLSFIPVLELYFGYHFYFYILRPTTHNLQLMVYNSIILPLFFLSSLSFLFLFFVFRPCFSFLSLFSLLISFDFFFFFTFFVRIHVRVVLMGLRILIFFKKRMKERR